jgi:hypothetical protein
MAEFRQLTAVDSNLYSEIDLVAARFSAYEKQKSLDNADKGALESELAQINAALLDIVNRLGKLEQQPPVAEPIA